MKLLRCALATLLMLLPLLGIAADVPDAPAGYSWHDFKPGKISLLKPDGWFVKTDSRNGTEGLFISKEPIKAEGKFSTGLSMNYVAGIRKKAGVSSAEYAKSFLAEAASQHEVLTSFQAPVAEGITGMGLRVKLADGDPAIVHYFLIADDNTDSLRLLFFEAPEAEWETAWKFGQVMLKGRILE